MTATSLGGISQSTGMQKYKIVEQKIMDDIYFFEELFKEHWEEVAKNKKLMILKPDYEKYKMLESCGIMKTIVAYDGDVVVGYSVNFIQPHLHYSDVVSCFNDIVFLSKEKRNSPLGLKLIRETERAAKRWGAHMMLWHVKEGTSIDKILPRIGYGIQDIVYSKTL